MGIIRFICLAEAKATYTCILLHLASCIHATTRQTLPESFSASFVEPVHRQVLD